MRRVLDRAGAAAAVVCREQPRPPAAVSLNSDDGMPSPGKARRPFPIDESRRIRVGHGHTEPIGARGDGTGVTPPCDARADCEGVGGYTCFRVGQVGRGR